MKHVIAKKSSKLNQSDYSGRVLRDEKSQQNNIVDNCYIATMVFRQYDATPTISLELSLRVATHLAVNISGFSAKVFF